MKINIRLRAIAILVLLTFVTQDVSFALAPEKLSEDPSAFQRVDLVYVRMAIDHETSRIPAGKLTLKAVAAAARKHKFNITESRDEVIVRCSDNSIITYNLVNDRIVFRTSFLGMQDSRQDQASDSRALRDLTKSVVIPFASDGTNRLTSMRINTKILESIDPEDIEGIKELVSREYSPMPNKRTYSYRLKHPLKVRWAGTDVLMDTIHAKGVLFDSREKLGAHYGSGYSLYKIVITSDGRISIKEHPTAPEGACLLGEAEREFLIMNDMYFDPYFQKKGVMTKYPIGVGRYPGTFYEFPEESGRKGQKEEIGFVLYGTSSYQNIRYGKISPRQSKRFIDKDGAKAGLMLSAMHKRGITHRWLHSGNFMVFDSVAIVHDLGLSKSVWRDKLSPKIYVAELVADLYYVVSQLEDNDGPEYARVFIKGYFGNFADRNDVLGMIKEVFNTGKVKPVDGIDHPLVKWLKENVIKEAFGAADNPSWDFASGVYDVRVINRPPVLDGTTVPPGIMEIYSTGSEIGSRAQQGNIYLIIDTIGSGSILAENTMEPDFLGPYSSREQKDRSVLIHANYKTGTVQINDRGAMVSDHGVEMAKVLAAKRMKEYGEEVESGRNRRPVDNQKTVPRQHPKSEGDAVELEALRKIATYVKDEFVDKSFDYQGACVLRNGRMAWILMARPDLKVSIARTDISGFADHTFLIVETVLGGNRYVVDAYPSGAMISAADMVVMPESEAKAKNPIYGACDILDNNTLESISRYISLDLLSVKTVAIPRSQWIGYSGAQDINPGNSLDPFIFKENLKLNDIMLYLEGVRRKISESDSLNRKTNADKAIRSVGQLRDALRKIIFGRSKKHDPCIRCLNMGGCAVVDSMMAGSQSKPATAHVGCSAKCRISDADLDSAIKETLKLYDELDRPDVESLEFIGRGADSSVYKDGKRVFKVYADHDEKRILEYQKATAAVKKLLTPHSGQDTLVLNGREYRVIYEVNSVTRVFKQKNSVMAESVFVDGIRLSALFGYDTSAIERAIVGMREDKVGVYKAMVSGRSDIMAIKSLLNRYSALISDDMGMDGITLSAGDNVIVDIDPGSGTIVLKITDVCSAIDYLEPKSSTKREPTEVSGISRVYGLLDPVYIEDDMAVKSIINPDDRPVRAIYGGSGTDISNFLLSTNASQGYFIARYKNMDSTSLEYGRSRLGSYKAGLPLSADYVMSKKRAGYAANTGVGWGVREMADNLAVELAFMGVDDFTIRYNKNGRSEIVFMWAYPGQAPKERVVTFVDEDVIYPSGYDDILNEPADIYYQRAAENIPGEYAKRNSFIDRISAAIKDGGYFVTDDYTTSGGYANKPVPFPGNMPEMGVLGREDRIGKVYRLRYRPDFNEGEGPDSLWFHYGWRVTVRKKPSAKELQPRIGAAASDIKTVVVSGPSAAEFHAWASEMRILIGRLQPLIDGLENGNYQERRAVAGQIIESYKELQAVGDKLNYMDGLSEDVQFGTYHRIASLLQWVSILRDMSSADIDEGGDFKYKDKTLAAMRDNIVSVTLIMDGLCRIGNKFVLRKYPSNDSWLVDIEASVVASGVTKQSDGELETVSVDNFPARALFEKQFGNKTDDVLRFLGLSGDVIIKHYEAKPIYYSWVDDDDDGDEPMVQRVTSRHLMVIEGMPPFVFYSKRHNVDNKDKLSEREYREFARELEVTDMASAYGLAPREAEVMDIHGLPTIFSLQMDGTQLSLLKITDINTDIVEAIGAGMGRLHSIGIMHGDICGYIRSLRRDHIFVRNNPEGGLEVGFIDFGVSRHYKEKIAPYEKLNLDGERDEVCNGLANVLNHLNGADVRASFQKGYLSGVDSVSGDRSFVLANRQFRREIATKPITDEERILLSESLFTEGANTEDLEQIRLALAPILNKPGSHIEILNEKDIMERVTNSKSSKDKVAAILSREDKANNRAWSDPGKAELIKATVLFADNKLTGANYLHLTGLIGFTRAVMARDRDKVAMYYKLLTGDAIEDEALNLLDVAGSNNTIPFAVNLVLRFKPIKKIDPAEFDTLRIAMENFLISA